MRTEIQVFCFLLCFGSAWWVHTLLIAGVEEDFVAFYLILGCNVQLVFADQVLSFVDFSPFFGGKVFKLVL